MCVCRGCWLLSLWWLLVVVVTFAVVVVVVGGGVFVGVAVVAVVLV